MENRRFDTIIIGGSYAGLSAALSLGRSLRKVLVIDSGAPCNAPTPRSHNFLTQDGAVPSVIAGIGRNQVAAYDTIVFLEDLAVRGMKENDGFRVFTSSGEAFYADSLIFATGIKDQLPEIPGLAACWGKTVIHCPYCHGFEHRNRNTVLLADGEAALHLVPLVSNLTSRLTLVTNGRSELTEDQKEMMLAKGIGIIEKEVSYLEQTNGQLRRIVFADGHRLEAEVMYARVPFVQHSDIPEALGCEFTATGHLKTDIFQETSVPGVFACGDNAAMLRSVANAVAAGSLAGASVNRMLAGRRSR